jgi:hypothetical protein
LRRWLWILLLPVVAAPVIAFFAVRNTATGYFSPVYSPDGSEVYYISRDSEALTAGLTLESFTPEAPVYILRDRFALWRIRAAGGSPQLVRSWAPSPLEGQWIRTRRGEVFSSVRTHLRWSPQGELEYMAAVILPRKPTEETWTIVRDWDPVTTEMGGHDGWRREAASMAGVAEAAVWGDWEVVLAPGTAPFPCAIAAHNEVTYEFRVLLQKLSCDGLSWDALARYSRRAEVLRLQEIRSVYERLVTDAMASGLSEGEAMLAANREMEKLGYQPRIMR